MILIIDVPTVLTSGAAIAEGCSAIDRESVEQALADRESRGFLLRTSVTQIWQGERDGGNADCRAG